MSKVQKNIRVDEEVAKWMDNHVLSNNSIVCYALNLMMQIEANATKQVQTTMQILYVPNPNEIIEKLPF